MLGEIMVRSDAENVVLLPKAALIDMLTPTLQKVICPRRVVRLEC
jgi:alpha-D-ribose 1-methylphosphonate 5-triphosphate diphosphatase PhnM